MAKGTVPLIGSAFLILALAACGGPTRQSERHAPTTSTSTSAQPTSTSTTLISGAFSWSSHQSPGLGGEFAGELSCPAVKFCAAVAVLSGSYPQPAEVGLAEFNGSAWSKPTAEPSFSQSDVTVSCSEPTFCLAASSNGLYVIWDGASWSAPGALPLGKTSEPSQVSCANSTFCMADNGELSGTTGLAQTLYATWNGTRWSAVTSLEDLDIASVSCLNQNFCMGVGETTISSGGNLSANDIGVAWNGSSWGEPVEMSESSAIGASGRISCANAGFCMAVGGFHATGDEFTIWNGTDWSPQTPDTATGLSPTGFVAVSCPSPSLCVAVDGGSGVNGQPSTDEPPTVGVWNAGSWTGTHQQGLTNALDDVSCPSVDYCVILATGDYLISTS